MTPPDKHATQTKRKSITPTQRLLTLQKKLMHLQKIKFALLLFFIAAAISWPTYRIWAEKETNGEEYERRALAQLINNREDSNRIIAPKRGGITDRNQEGYLATSLIQFSAFMDVRLLLKEPLQKRMDTLQTVHDILGIDLTTLHALLRVNDENNTPLFDTSHYVFQKEVPYQVGKALEAALKEKNLSHIYIEETMKRVYPMNSIASSVIGFMRGETGATSFGLEKSYNHVLAGVPGRVFRTFDTEEFIETNQIGVQNGQTIVTTLDFNLQRVADELTKKYGDLNQAENASTIVMNPNTGEILAMSQYFNIDLNNSGNIAASNAQVDIAQWKELTPEEQTKKLNQIWQNFNVSSTIEPGSIFKPITIAAALEKGVITTNSTFVCNGYKTVAGWRIHCHKTSGHGLQTLEQAMANSCNVALMDIAEKMGPEAFYQYQKDFGYGQATGIDLPAEEKGLVFLPSALKASELATSSFGQRFKCTPIQAITAFAATINGGNLLKPYVVSQITDTSGQVVQENKPVVVRKVISSDVSATVRNMMEKVVSPSGTGKKAMIDGYRIGGKTGTAEQGIKGTDEYSHSVSFIAYLPVEKPEYLVLTFLHKPAEFKDGVTSAAPMMKEFLEEMIRIKNIKPSKDTTESDELFLSNYIDMNLVEATAHLSALGLNYELLGGSGAIVSSQFPSEGTKMSDQSVVFLTIKNQDGYEMEEVPNLKGIPLSQAKTLLESIGFSTKIMAEKPQPSAAPQMANEGVPQQTATPLSEPIVTFQTPEAGVLLMKGTEIQIKISP